MIFNLVEYLNTQLTPLIFTSNGWLKDTPEEALAVIENGGSVPAWINRKDFAIQILSRANSKVLARKNANTVFDYLNNRFSGLVIPAVTVEAVVYPAVTTYQILANQIPGYIGSTDANLEMYSVNFRITTE